MIEAVYGIAGTLAAAMAVLFFLGRRVTASERSRDEKLILVIDALSARVRALEVQVATLEANVTGELPTFRDPRFEQEYLVDLDPPPGLEAEPGLDGPDS